VLTDGDLIVTNCVVCVVLTDSPDADELSVIIGVDVVVDEVKLGDNTIAGVLIDADAVLTDGDLIVTNCVACAVLTDLPVDDKPIETDDVACATLADLPVADKLSVIIGVDVVVVESKLGDNTVGAGVLDVVADVVLTDGDLIVIVVVVVVLVVVVADAVVTDGELIVTNLIT
jgi:hypothetical protein